MAMIDHLAFLISVAAARTNARAGAQRGAGAGSARSRPTTSPFALIFRRGARQ